MCADEKDRSGNVTTGLILMIVGAVILAAQFDLVSFRQIWRYWPAALIVLGLVHVFMPRPDDRWTGGVMNILLGIVFFAINFGWMGLDWGSGWPLILVAIGLSMTLRAMFGSRGGARRGDESGATVVEEERRV